MDRMSFTMANVQGSSNCKAGAKQGRRLKGETSCERDE